MRYLLFTPLSQSMSGSRIECLAMTNDELAADTLSDDLDYVLYDTLSDAWSSTGMAMEDAPNAKYNAAMDIVFGMFMGAVEFDELVEDEFEDDWSVTLDEDEGE